SAPADLGGANGNLRGRQQIIQLAQLFSHAYVLEYLPCVAPQQGCRTGLPATLEYRSQGPVSVCHADLVAYHAGDFDRPQQRLFGLGVVSLRMLKLAQEEK